MSEVSQHNLIETIEKALEAATPGPWIYDETVGDVYAEKTDEIICCANIANAHLIANAPEWLRALLEEVRHFKRIYMNAHVRTEELKDELSAKDKVLEHIATKTHGSAEMARTILSQYRGESHE